MTRVLPLLAALTLGCGSPPSVELCRQALAELEYPAQAQEQACATPCDTLVREANVDAARCRRIQRGDLPRDRVACLEQAGHIGLEGEAAERMCNEPCDELAAIFGVDRVMCERMQRGLPD